MNGFVGGNGPVPVRRRLPGTILAGLLLLAACGGPKEPLLVPPPPMPPPPPPTTPLAQEPSAPQRPGALQIIPFTIQVGAFTSPDRAAALSERLQARGVDAYYFVDKDHLYKVRFERFETLADAQRRAKSLQARGLIQDFYIAQPAPSRTPAQSPTAIQESLVATARRFLGKPYRYGKASQKDGFDCSGLTMTVYRLHGLELPRSSFDQFSSGTPVGPNALEPGDLVFFATGRTSRVSHVGIYSGNGQFIHAATRERAVHVSSLANSYFKRRYKGARRYF